jgi:hypothetical protein
MHKANQPKAVTVRCEHTPRQTHLRVAESNICCIQCGLIQLTLSASQAARVSRHCHCMPPNLYFGAPLTNGRATMTIDPSQLDLKGEAISAWLIG